MFNFDNQKHHKPHIHAQYQDSTAIFNIESGDIIDGAFNQKSTKLVQAWIEIHRDELVADWELAINGEKIFKIKPLD
jgi:hypothetical protein